MSEITPYNDQDYLVNSLKARDARAISYLYDHYSGALYGVIIRIVKKEEWADEVLQDVFLKVWERIEKFDSKKGRLYTWMYRLARNSAIDKLRSLESTSTKKTDSIGERVYTVDQRHQTQQHVDGIGLDSLLKGLRKEEREVIEWTYLQEYSQSEMSKETGIPIGTIKTRARAAMSKLRQMINLKDK